MEIVISGYISTYPQNTTWLTSFIFLQWCYSFGFLHLTHDPFPVNFCERCEIYPCFYFCIWTSDCSSTIWKVDCHSPLDCFLILCQRSTSWPYLYGSLFFYTVEFLSILLPILSSLDSYGFMLSPEIPENVFFYSVIPQIISQYNDYMLVSNSFWIEQLK